VDFVVEDLGLVDDLADLLPADALPFAQRAPFASEGFLVGRKHCILENLALGSQFGQFLLDWRGFDEDNLLVDEISHICLWAHHLELHLSFLLIKPASEQVIVVVPTTDKVLFILDMDYWCDLFLLEPVSFSSGEAAMNSTEPTVSSRATDAHSAHVRWPTLEPWAWLLESPTLSPFSPALLAPAALLSPASLTVMAAVVSMVPVMLTSTKARPPESTWWPLLPIAAKPSGWRLFSPASPRWWPTESLVGSPAWLWYGIAPLIILLSLAKHVFKYIYSESLNLLDRCQSGIEPINGIVLGVDELSDVLVLAAPDVHARELQVPADYAKARVDLRGFWVEAGHQHVVQAVFRVDVPAARENQSVPLIVVGREHQAQVFVDRPRDKRLVLAL
jgi:hypothetical protein